MTRIGADDQRSCETVDPDWKAVASELAVALEAVQEGWLYQTAADAKDCPASIRAAAAEKFCTGLGLRRTALAAYQTALGKTR